MGKGMMMGVGLLLAFRAEGAIQIQREKCTDEFRNHHYVLLVQSEKAVGEAFNKMVMESGTTNPTNCIVEYPSDNGRPVYGLRRVVMDMQWYAIRTIHGIEKREFRQQAMEILYDLRRGQTGEIRDVVGLTVCRTPEICRQKELPFATSSEPVQPSDPLPTETY